MARVKLDNYVVPEAPRLGVRGWLRWMWRQVTSMRVAIILLLLLAAGAIPGSILPQRPREPAGAAQFVRDNGWWGEVLDRVGLLDVYGSAWFTAIYVLLFASLIGCIIPRALAHYRALRAPISAVPTSLDRYEYREVGSSPDDAAAIVGRAVATLRPRPSLLGAISGYRVRVDERVGRAGTETAIAGDRGHIREVGNLLFHTALVGILIAIAFGALFTYRGQAIIVEGRSFTNAVVAYDTFNSGRLFNSDRLYPFTLKLDAMRSTFSASGRPEDFTAHVTLTEPGQASRTTDIRVNKPLGVSGASIYLQGNGYAPDLTFTDSDGKVAFDGPVIFLPKDAAYTSTGVVKIPDVTSGEQIGIKATVYPSALGDGTDLVSIHPDAANPVIVLTAYTGDLGLDAGTPQNVYRLDESKLSPVRDAEGGVATLVIRPGETLQLPKGLGSLTWNSLPRFAAFDLRADPSLPSLLAFAILALGGLALSLFGSRRRIWLVLHAHDGTTVVTGAALAPPHDTAVAEALARTMAAAVAKEENA